MNSQEKARLQFTLKGMLWSLLVLGAFFALLAFQRLYQDYDPIPFTWSALRWHKAAIVIPWLVMAAGYLRYRLFAATTVHTFVVTLFVLGRATAFAFGRYPEDALNFTYGLVNHHAQWFIYAAYFSLPLAALTTVARVATRSPVAVDKTGNRTSVEGRQKERFQFTVTRVLAVILINMQMVVVLLLSAWPDRVPRGHEEQWIARHETGPEDRNRPEPELIASDVPIEGRWQQGDAWVDILPTSEQGKYWVGLGMHSNLGPAIVKRIGSLDCGELVLDRPAIASSHYLYTRLYVIRWQGREMLLPSAHVKGFREERQMSQSATGGPPRWRWCVLFRKPGS